MKIIDDRIVKPTKFGDLKVGDVFQDNIIQNIFIKINYEYGNINAFCLSRNNERRFCVNDEITLLDVELIINGQI